MQEMTGVGLDQRSDGRIQALHECLAMRRPVGVAFSQRRWRSFDPDHGSWPRSDWTCDKELAPRAEGSEPGVTRWMRRARGIRTAARGIEESAPAWLRH
jgi:hypothetical protein